ncbi:peptidoglycan DD-metalloendopeptidase family protein [Streptomyces sp. NPDC002561]|uniref:peptidoglycan DD-metalloendopeptidase family protein n=1 Tax=Streptomyces sp. NPDC002561 TaxID=3154418 RepID=UPI00332E5BA4
MADLDIVGGAAVDVVPVIPQFHAKLKAMVLPIADKVGEEAGKRMGEAISKNIVIAIPQAINRGGAAGVRAAGKQGDDAGGAFARSIRRKLEAAFKAMPKLDIRLGDTGVDAELARIRAKLEQLSNKRIGIDVSAEAAQAEVTRLEEQLRRLGAAHPNIAVRADTATARAALAEIRAEISALTRRPGVIELEVDGALGAKMRAVIAQAQASLPEINVDADTNPARAEIQSLRARLAALSDVRIGIDMDAGEALAEIQAIQTRLEILSVQRHDIDVRVDAAAAAAQLAALQAMADGTKTFNIRALADTSQATNALLHLGIQMAVLTAIPLGPVLAAGLGAVVSMAAAAAAGVGSVALVAIPAVKGVADALKAKTAAEDEAAKATTNGARESVQAAQRALQLAGAQASLASAHRNAARSIATANRGVEDAERALAQAGVRAMDQRRQAAESVERAERSLSDAKTAARRAEQDLTQARRDAAQQLADLNDRLLDGALDQREATLRVEQAQQDLNAARMDPRATDLQRRQAELALDRAKQNAAEQAKGYVQLQQEAKKQRAAGVEGSDAVKQATERLSRAQRDVGDNTKALTDAQRQAARAQTEAAQTVADAQRRLADAVQNAADAQVSASESIASAERGLQSARLSGIDTTTKAVSKSEEYRKALAKLTPEQRALFDSIVGPRGLKTAFDEWQKSLHPEVLPLFTRGVESAKATLPGLTPLVLGAAAGIQTLWDKASAELKEPFWMSFKADLKDNVEPAVVGFGVAFGNIIKGLAGIIDAFLPHMQGIADHSDRITERFARWGTSLKGSPDFERFLQYVKDTSPGLAEFLGDLLSTALDLTQALSPLSGAMFATLQPVLDGISWIANNAPEVIQVLWGIYFAQKAIQIGMAAFAAAMFLYESVMIIATIATSGWAAALTATGVVPIIRAIILVVALLAAGVIYAYKNWDWFRAAVDGAWEGIKIASQFVWDNVLKPIFSALWAVLKNVGDIAIWLWKNAIVPAFNGIKAIIEPVAKVLLTIFLLPVYVAFEALGVVIKWLWKEVVSPVFNWIAEKAKWLYEKHIKPHMGDAKKAFEILGRAVKASWDLVFGPVLGWIGDKVKWLYDKAIKPNLKHIGTALDLMALGFKNAKDDIKKHWDQLSNIAKKPVKFIIEHVYNGGIVPLWNKVADITGAGKLKKMDVKNFHTGGIMSGYSPGRDDRIIAVGGGEAIMRPEWTRAVGAERINQWNAAARSGGVGGVQRAISNGTPAFKDGGIVGWFKDRGNDVGNFISGAKDAAADALGFLDPANLFDKATGFIRKQLDGIAENGWSRAVVKMPLRMLSDLKDRAVNFFTGGGEGGGQWAKPVNAGYGTRFGVAGSMWSSGRHTGLDFPAAVGTAIRAVAGGRVALAQGGGPYGNHVRIDHGGGLSSLYAHMSKILTSVGKTVQQGQTIGTVGQTGNTTGPHLHLEARVNGRSVDPMPYLTGGGGGGGRSGNGGSGVSRWRSTVLRALGMTGNPASYADLTLRRMAQESGGNPLAVNRWDSNWKAGHPSVGLMQVIGPTFRSFAGSMRNTGPFSYGVSTNPLANIYASMRYAKSAYGSLPAAYNRPGGYASGGLPGVGELAWVGEHGPELVRFLAPTQVYSAADSASLARSMRTLPAQGGGSTTITADVRVYVGDREITDIVRTEVVAREEQTAAAITTGRWT